MKSTVVVALAIGCSGRPAAVDLPDFDPEQIGVNAVEFCDRDGDGFISAEESKESKSLEAAKSRVARQRRRENDRRGDCRTYSIVRRTGYGTSTGTVPDR